MRELELKKIIPLAFPPEQYIREVHPKKQIYLHHTASGKGVTGDFRHFMSTKARIATCVIVGDDGIYQLFSSKYWGHHLGIKRHVFEKKGLPSINTPLNRQSIAIEIDSWGPLAKLGDHFFSWAGTKVLLDGVTEYSREYKTYPQSKFFDEVGVTGEPCHFYESYSANKIEYTRQLLVFWNKLYSIPIDKYDSSIFGITDQALTGEPGVYTHNSVRVDKSDIHPQPEIIKMLEGLR